MKKKLTIILTFLISAYAFSQNNSDMKAVADFAVKMFTWDIQQMNSGTLMFLDVPYQRDNKESLDYLTLTVAKGKEQIRPDFISIIIPCNILISNGIFIIFGNGEVEKANPIRILFESCNDEFCTARIIGGFGADEVTKEKVDIFQKFLDFEYVYFLFIYPDGIHKSVSVPLFSFKDQYRNI
jgi:hypothetical protein